MSQHISETGAFGFAFETAHKSRTRILGPVSLQLVITFFLSFLLCAGAFAQSSPSTQKSSAPEQSRSLKAACSQLRLDQFSALQDAPTRLVKAEFEYRANLGAGVCRIEGYVHPRVGFAISLPENWNQKFLHIGCGGHCGELFEEYCNSALGKGYGCLVSDMGHRSSVDDGLWAYNNLEAEIDWGFRATHVATLAGKAVIASVYGARPTHSYFAGCSTGGRQGLISAQYFPWDFDGIIIGAPAIDLTTLYVNFAWNAVAVRNPEGNYIFSREDFENLNRYVVGACDALDGEQDDVISRPEECAISLSEIECAESTPEAWCMTREQIAAVQKIYKGPRTSEGFALSRGGPLKGSEANWVARMLGGLEWAGRSWNDRSIDRLATEQGFGYMMFPSDPGYGWKAEDFDFDEDFKRLGMMEFLYSSTNPDLEKFRRRGGKIIGFHGLSDESIPPQYFSHYFDSVAKLLGGPDQEIGDFFRLFLIPGMDHCSGGVGASGTDYLHYLEQWVEHDNPPAELRMIKPKSEKRFSFMDPAFPIDKSTIVRERVVGRYSPSD